MQHYGAPTRLVDVTFNAYIGLWFAVEEKVGLAPNGRSYDEMDGRLFAFDVTKRVLTPGGDRASWEPDEDLPWARLVGADLDEWSAVPAAWIPSPFERRIAAQQGGFLLGGVPIYETQVAKLGKRRTASATTKFQWPTDTTSAAKWDHSSVLRSTCLQIRPHKFGAKRGKPAETPCYTFRVAADAKKSIRSEPACALRLRAPHALPGLLGFRLVWTSDVDAFPARSLRGAGRRSQAAGFQKTRRS